MLPKKNRLTSAQFYYNTTISRRLTSKFLTIITKQGSSISPRVVIQVPKRLDKRSVVRNRIKRMIQEAVRPLLPTLDRLDILIKAHKTISSSQRKELVKETACLLKGV